MIGLALLATVGFDQASAMMAEGYSLYLGPTDTKSIDEKRRDFVRYVRATLQEKAAKETRAAAYQALFGADPETVLQPPCDLKKKFGDRGVRISLDYELHGEMFADMFKKKLIEQANRGELAVLIESDMVPSTAAKEVETSILQKGLTRTAQILGVKGSDHRYVHGIDDARLRAFGLTRPDFSNESQVGFVTDIFRNPVLREMFRSLHKDDFNQACEWKGKVSPLCLKELWNDQRRVQHWLKKLDESPGLNFDKVQIGLETPDLRGVLLSKVSKAFPEVDKLAWYQLMLFEMRDHTMSQAVLNRLCDQTGDVRDFHVVIGAIHVDGIKLRLSRALGDVKLTLSEQNIMTIEREKLRRLIQVEPSASQPTSR